MCFVLSKLSRYFFLASDLKYRVRYSPSIWMGLPSDSAPPVVVDLLSCRLNGPPHSPRVDALQAGIVRLRFFPFDCASRSALGCCSRWLSKTLHIEVHQWRQAVTTLKHQVSINGGKDADLVKAPEVCEAVWLQVLHLLEEGQDLGNARSICTSGSSLCCWPCPLLETTACTLPRRTCPLLGVPPRCGG